MDLAQLQAFEATVRLGSISAAAGELGYSQSAVSRQVQALERLLGADLLRRGPRGVRPTARGSALLPHARDIVAAWEAARADVTGLAVGRTRLRIGTFPAGTSTLIAPVLGELERRGLSIGVRQAPSPALETAVAAGDLDGALVMESERARPSLRTSLLVTDQMVVITPRDHPAATEGRARELSDFSSETWVEEEGRPERVLIATSVRAGFSPQRLRRTPDLGAKVSFVAAGLGVALVPGLLVGAVHARVGVVRLIDPPRRGVSWIERVENASDAQSAGLAQVRSMLVDVAASVTGAPSANSP